MALMLPNEVAIFLNLLGVPWVNVDEDEVRRLAAHVRSFVADVESTFGDATAEITAMGADYSGESYEALLATWARLSDTHLAAFETGGHTVAATMDIAADLIVAAKVVSIVELSALAVGAGALLITGVGTTLQPLVLAAARRIVSALKSYIGQYVFFEVLERAIAEFETEIQRIVDAAAEQTFDTASRLLGVPASPGELRIDTDEVLRRAQVLENYADDIAAHYRRFSDNVADINIDPMRTTTAWRLLSALRNHKVRKPIRHHPDRSPRLAQLGTDESAPDRNTSQQSMEPTHARAQALSGGDPGHAQQTWSPSSPLPAASPTPGSLPPATETASAPAAVLTNHLHTRRTVRVSPIPPPNRRTRPTTRPAPPPL
ncbi:hypothetical protein [Nocardia brasiliensis]|uniref:hypothetical protein n=1 Tax=Nocardia brasiliensis TaxID=37326 RepID=UPI0024554611|nr:hypothetical protein [Nocardia brasiliensis]